MPLKKAGLKRSAFFVLIQAERDSALKFVQLNALNTVYQQRDNPCRYQDRYAQYDAVVPGDHAVADPEQQPLQKKYRFAEQHARREQ